MTKDACLPLVLFFLRPRGEPRVRLAPREFDRELPVAVPTVPSRQPGLSLFQEISKVTYYLYLFFFVSDR